MITNPDPDTVRYPQITIFIPYTHIQPATLISLIGYDYTPVALEGDFGYWKYFKQRWDEGKTFINIEHDVIVYPSALKALWDCPRPWCVYDYHLPNHWERNLENEQNGVPLGCMKITTDMITQTKHLWEAPVIWDQCDQHLTKQSHLTVHQHYPSVVNGNMALLPQQKAKQ